ncbi:MAG TPA: BTAD domain-containing putative transcriptional regulator, partial [Stackebrandtia sp.]|uniref:AfsR/SARP family transcriptional regulator n=1 Tax=Stackebrandtia sp. TaxID=2023065 RepID=UPI002D4B65C7
MEFRVLGPMQVFDDGQPVPIGGGRGKAVLAALLLHANKTVSRSRLIDLVWATAPDSVGSNLRSYLAKLRKSLCAPDAQHPRIVADPHGFRIVVADGELDLAEFECLAAAGEKALADGDPAAAAEDFAAALALWRGPALGGVMIEPGLAAAVAHLTERRDRVELRGIEARMAMGRHADLVGELRSLVAAQPLREHLVALLMLALYRSGRQKEALSLYRDTRHRLVEDLGVEPGTELDETHRRILAADPDLDSPPPRPRPAATATARVVPSQLPADIPAFTGRDRELAAVRAHARGCAEAAGTAVVTALDGMAGVGKTTLAVHAARQLAADFPDGQLFIDLRGYSGTDTPVEPGQALDRLLRSLGVPPAAIPADTDDRAALYRSLLSDRRMLVVLDNAVDEAQVRPLLPGDSSCLVIVTSRRHLSALDEAAPVPVEVLEAPEAGALFVDVAGVAADRPESRALVAAIVEACGRLPLAVRIAASRLRSRPQWSLEDLRDKLLGGGAPLARLEYRQRSVAAAFDMSYDELDDAHATLFRALGLAPGPDCGVAAACALVGASDRDAVEARLEDLVDAHLLESRRPGRYGFHDLVRAYARDLAERLDTPAARHRATDNVVDHYL